MNEISFELITTVKEARRVCPDVASLFHEIFKRDFPNQLWEQYYFSNPYGDPIEVVVYHNDKAVGHYALIPQILVDSYDYKLPYALSVSTMLHPDYRRGDALFTMLEIAVEAANAHGLGFIMGFPNQHAYLPLVKLFGWQLSLETPLYQWEPTTYGTLLPDVSYEQRWSLSTGEFGHPDDDRYHHWRSMINQYFSASIGQSVHVVYKLQETEGVLNVLDLQTDGQLDVEIALATLALKTGMRLINILGIHADKLNIANIRLKKHNDYILRLCTTPLCAPVPNFRTSLLLSDVF